MMKWIREKIIHALGGVTRTERVGAEIHAAANLATALSAGRHKHIWLALDKDGIWVQGRAGGRQAHECVKWETVWIRPGWLEPTVRRISKMMDDAWRASLRKDGVDDAAR